MTLSDLPKACSNKVSCLQEQWISMFVKNRVKSMQSINKFTHTLRSVCTKRIDRVSGVKKFNNNNLKEILAWFTVLTVVYRRGLPSRKPMVVRNKPAWQLPSHGCISYKEGSIVLGRSKTSLCTKTFDFISHHFF